ncbi:FG-GAP repeat domain-containing protein [Marinobacter sp.]|uniref:FG-GAP repeat domain-containing protein n=1 Tax=Marinobacter sp. TaxID=50741 RepID=UPI003A933556
MNRRHITSTSLGAAVTLILLVGCGGDGGSEGSGPAAIQLYDNGQTLVQGGSLGRAAGGQAMGWNQAYVADLTGDGRDELIIYASFDGLQQQDPSPLVVFGLREGKLLNITDELFPGGSPSAIFNRRLLISDFNGDGLSDLFLDNHGTEAITPFPGEQNRLYLSDGNGQWFDATQTHLPKIRDFSHGSTAGDIDGDGISEIYVVNLGGGEAGYGGSNYLMGANESGKFEVIASIDNPGDIFPAEIQQIGRPFFSQFVDLTGTGLMDLFRGPLDMPRTEGPGYGLSVLINDGSGAFELADPETLPMPRFFPEFDPPVGYPETILTGDITGDGLTDLVTFDRYGAFVGSYYSVFINQGDGTLSEETELRLPGQSFGPLETNIPSAQLVDLNGDGHLDFIARGYNVSEDPTWQTFITWIYLNDGEGHFTPQPESQYPNFNPAFVIFDADGDGRKDIVTSTTDYSQPDPETFLHIYRRL